MVSCTVITTHGWRTSTSARPKVGEFYSHVDYHRILIAPVTSVEIVPYLKTLINEHHESFCQLYSDSPVIPKMHYVIHLPDWMLRYSTNKNIPLLYVLYMHVATCL